ncbi:hypothetical protein MMC08_001837 [Hypocenomyce scalaris]|nr:hypothetical protein [Hypocenomyce scalaris]
MLHLPNEVDQDLYAVLSAIDDPSSRVEMPSPQRRPRDKGSTGPGNVTAKELALSNSTMTKFLGGKQKAWMTGHLNTLGPASSADSGVQLSDREAVRQPSERSTMVESAMDTNTFQSEEPPTPQVTVSESTSPMMSNSLQSNAAAPKSTVSTADAVLPSPAPSDEVHQESIHVAHLEEAGETREEAFMPPEPNATRLTELAVKYGGIEEIEKLLQSAEYRENITEVPLGEETNTVRVSGRSLSRTSSREQSQNKRPRVLPPNPMATPPHRPQTKATDQRTATIGNVMDSSQSLPLTASQLSNPPVAPQGLSLRPLIAVIDSQVHALGGHQAMHATIEGPRLSLLHDACQNGDCFYLVLHQVYCLSSSEPETTSRLPGFGLEQREGMNTVSSLLLPNSGMPDHVVRWFATFPLQVDTALRTSELYHAAYKSVIECLPYFTQRWQNFKAECHRRQYPPLVDELESLLGVCSKTLQRVISTAIHRSFWVGEQDQCYRKGTEIFLRNQRDHQQRLNRLNTASPPTAAEVRSQNQQVVIAHQKTYLQHMQHLRLPTQINIPQPGHASPGTITPMLPPQHTQGSVSQHGSRHAPHAQPHLQSRPAVVRPTNRTSSRSSSLNIDTCAAQLEWPATLGTAPIVPSTPIFAQQTSPAIQSVRPAGSVSIASSPTVAGSSLSPATQAIQYSAMHEPHHHRTWSNQSCHPQSPLYQESQSPWATNPGVSFNATPAPPPSQLQHHSHQQRPSRRPGPQSDLFRPYVPTQAASGPQSDHFRPYASIQPSISPSMPQQPNSMHSPLIPPPGHAQPPPAHPNPNTSALHQSHLRSPVLKIVNTLNYVDKSTKFFQYVNKLALGPTPLDQRCSGFVWDFVVSAAEYQVLATDTPLPSGAPSTRTMCLGSQTYRLRSFEHTAIGSAYHESEWVVAETTWPANILISMNGTYLETRRKLHHGKDLPVDVTPYITEGTNILQMWIIWSGQERERHTRYSVGVEVIEITDYQTIKEGATPRAHSETSMLIKQSMTSSDPDVQIVDESINIDLVDPYTARIFEVPARGRSCRHHQCFDLDTFLQTRRSKYPCWPGLPDEWKCPICGADARPQNLLIDGFFINVREELRRLDRLEDARAIVFEKSGEWQVKADEEAEETGVGSGRHVPHTEAVSAGGAAVRQRQESVVIEIDDD